MKETLVKADSFKDRGPCIIPTNRYAFKEIGKTICFQGMDLFTVLQESKEKVRLLMK